MAGRAGKRGRKRAGKHMGWGGVGCVVKSMVGGRLASGNHATATVELSEHMHMLDLIGSFSYLNERRRNGRQRHASQTDHASWLDYLI